MGTLAKDTASTWVRRWDVQQEHYMADREERFAVLCDVVEAALADVPEPVVVDLGCGPGSLAARLRQRLPSARIIGIDSDPLLLGLAKAHYGNAIAWVDANLNSPTWADNLPATIHGAVSTTALHWLPADRLAEVYRVLGARVAEGGVFANGDHLKISDTRLDTLARLVRHRRSDRAGVEKNEDWQQWWDAIAADPAFAELTEARAERKRRESSDDRSHTETDKHGNGLTIDEHTTLLRSSGFRSVAPLWQVGDDHVLVGLR